ncbi:heterokaryon incompatibility protein-domain-containing protein [Thelonectria olida]|uniref:Heterokaryon incompatibility protein-domain-containing protein n=1 Tax=Thelonectria olida TaxID=1576542 RepID=A0A9P8W5C8_9HYPO|nr:heterokaryon incompatibility protein-domain-containing protein [Thelonectria olida]
MPPVVEEARSQQNFYSALKEGEIRLLKILPGSERVACEIRTFKVRDNPDYIALSYTWGPPTQPFDQNADDVPSRPNPEIDCNGSHRISVRENLHAFLLRTRSTGSGNFFWIDAICINQGDKQERSAQVKLMSTIYHSAASVHAWLGEEDDHTPRSFALIRALVRICVDTGRHERVESLKHITPNMFEAAGLENSSEVYADRGHWDSLIRLFQRSYFTRTWIIQEISLGQRIIAICGSHIINWRDITIISEFLTVTAWTRWISKRWPVEARQPNLQSNHAVPNLLDANKSAKQAGVKDTMLYSLIRFRRFQATDPRDKVDALLGIAKDSVRGKIRFNPTYEKSTEEIYTQAAIQILEDSDDLLLLAHAEGETFRQHRSLPSWVPDWSCERVTGLGVTGYRRYSAAGDLQRSLVIHERAKSLVVKGIRLDDIVFAGENKQDVLSGKPCPKWLIIWNAMPKVYHTGQSRFEVLWRTLITDTAGTPPQHPAPESYGPAYISWITSMLNAEANTEDTLDPTFRTALGALTEAEISQLVPSSEQTSNIRDNDHLYGSDPKIDSEEYEVTFSHALHLRPFLTGWRYLGVGSESLREHDSIWIIPGSRVPLILREVSLGKFQVGEALKTSPIYRDITIV